MTDLTERRRLQSALPEDGRVKEIELALQRRPLSETIVNLVLIWAKADRHADEAEDLLREIAAAMFARDAAPKARFDA